MLCYVDLDCIWLSTEYPSLFFLPYNMIYILSLFYLVFLCEAAKDWWWWWWWWCWMKGSCRQTTSSCCLCGSSRSCCGKDGCKHKSDQYGAYRTMTWLIRYPPFIIASQTLTNALQPLHFDFATGHLCSKLCIRQCWTLRRAHKQI